ncbi:hypothetical protein [Mucilaginibacter boryungensis]|uniref:Uncharacterized protein n=1 Tax=Mucilaginibacter boryungensis TaxID=768480 RepID=A0ABR9XCW6_9SPHI|nr:hypothetical protein [Mucilaginibacter boryungensis]MBE9665071.1 hypothetical protein [Mucilaginibacter boryungensis]
MNYENGIKLISQNLHLIDTMYNEMLISAIVAVPINADINGIANLIIDGEWDEIQHTIQGQQIQVVVLFDLDEYEPGDLAKWMPLSHLIGQ